jgi:DNA-directed RNA polymerase subunit RPC12/RpoP
MVFYNCFNCNKEFTDKSMYTRHLNRKNPCKKVDAENIPKNTENIPKNTENIKKEYICIYCHKKLARSTNLNYHLEKACKVKKQDNLEKETIYQHLLNEHLNIKNENKDIKTKLIEIEKKLSKNKIMNNNNNTNNINNGTINNIQIVAHGKKDLSQIKENVIIQLVKRGW